jgi:hypothetical protein
MYPLARLARAFTRLLVVVSPPSGVRRVSSAVEGFQLREILSGQLEVEDPAVVRDPVPVS